MYDIYVSPACELYHHGIKGMKWGVRRYQNPDGSLTDEGRKRYLKGYSRFNYESNASRKYAKKYGEDSEKYKKSRELDEKMASQYRDQGVLERVASVVNPTGWNTYQMSRATGRGQVESVVRSLLDVNVNTLLTGASVAGGALTGGVVAALSANRGMQKFLDIPASQLANMFTYVPGVGTVNAGSDIGRRVAVKQIAERAVNKGVNTGLAAEAGLLGGSWYAQNKMASRGKEMSAQQAWLRRDYTTKGSVQEQKSRRQEERERKRAARRSN